MYNLPVTRAGVSRPLRHIVARQFVLLTKATSNKRQATSTKLRQNAIIRI